MVVLNSGGFNDILYLGRWDFSRSNYVEYVSDTSRWPIEYSKDVGFIDSGSFDNSYGKRSEDFKTIYWYHTENYNAQMNTMNKVYKWLAIG